MKAANIIAVALVVCLVALCSVGVEAQTARPGSEPCLLQCDKRAQECATGCGDRYLTPDTSFSCWKTCSLIGEECMFNCHYPGSFAPRPNPKPVVAPPQQPQQLKPANPQPQPVSEAQLACVGACDTTNDVCKKTNKEFYCDDRWQMCAGRCAAAAKAARFAQVDVDADAETDAEADAEADSEAEAEAEAEAEVTPAKKQAGASPAVTVKACSNSCSWLRTRCMVHTKRMCNAHTDSAAAKTCNSKFNSQCKAASNACKAKCKTQAAKTTAKTTSKATKTTSKKK